MNMLLLIIIESNFLFMRKIIEGVVLCVKRILAPGILYTTVSEAIKAVLFGDSPLCDITNLRQMAGNA